MKRALNVEGKSLKAFVTGATGNVGRLLVEQLLLRGWSVDAFVLPKEDADFLVKEGVAVFRGDITDRVSVDRAIEKSIPDVLFHLAAYVRLGIVDNMKIKERMYNVNVNGTCNVLKSALRYNVKKAVYLSSVAIFGSSPEGNIMTEDTYPRAENVSVYGETKYLAYQQAMNIQEQGLALLLFIPGFIFGPGFSVTISFLKSFYEGQIKYLPDGYCEIKIPLVFNRDLAQAIFAGIEKNKFGEKYILVESSPSPQEALTLLAEMTGKETKFKFISYRRALFAIWLATAVNKFMRRAPKIADERVKSLFKSSQQFKWCQQFDTSKARRELDWEPTPLKDAFKETIDWFSENHVE